MSMSNILNINTSSIASPLIMKVLWRQQQELLTKSPDCVKIIINSEDPLDIQADITGPKETPYEGGLFRVKITVGSDFPYTAPKGNFMTKIFHPNVSERGEICVNTLKKDWNSKGWSLYNVLEVIKCLLIIPFPESSLNEEAGKQFMEDYNEYFKIARIFTQVYAKSGERERERDTEENIFMNTNLLAKGNSDVEMSDCHDEENIGYFNNQEENNSNTNSHTNTHTYTNTNNTLKIKSLSHEINYGNHNENSQNMNVLGNLDYGLLSRMPSKSFNIKHPQCLIKSKNSFLSSQNRKNSVVSNGDGEGFVNKPNLNSLPFILRSNSFCNNENVNFVMTQNSNANNTIFQNPTPTRSKKDEIKKWLSRI